MDYKHIAQQASPVTKKPEAIASSHTIKSFTTFGSGLLLIIWLSFLFASNAKATLNAYTPPTATILKAPTPPSLANPTTHWQAVTVQNGDNLAKIFARLGLDKQQVHAILALKTAKKPLTQLHLQK